MCKTDIKPNCFPRNEKKTTNNNKIHVTATCVLNREILASHFICACSGIIIFTCTIMNLISGCAFSFLSFNELMWAIPCIDWLHKAYQLLNCNISPSIFTVFIGLFCLLLFFYLGILILYDICHYSRLQCAQHFDQAERQSSTNC